VAIWLQLMLHETSGDLDVAVRAYHVGSADARGGAGDAYLAAVRDKRRRFIRNEESTPSWDFLFDNLLRPGAPSRLPADGPWPEVTLPPQA
jgi:hypothetical protein